MIPDFNFSGLLFQAADCQIYTPELWKRLFSGYINCQWIFIDKIYLKR
jgi:hypothetical protein